MRKLVMAAAAVGVLALAGQASASAIIYEISATASGSLGGVGFDNAALDIFAIADTTEILAGATFYEIDPLPLVRFTIDGGVSNVLGTPLRIGFSAASNNDFFFGNSANTTGINLFDFGVSVPVDISMAFGPLSATSSTLSGAQFHDLATTAGAFTVTQLSDITITATGGDLTSTLSSAPHIGGIPEPATWAMMILGLGGIGAVLRRQKGLSPAVEAT